MPYGARCAKKIGQAAWHIISNRNFPFIYPIEMLLERKISPKENKQNLKLLLAALRQHHAQSLELCAIMREGIRKKVALQRIKDYTDWRYATQLSPFFEMQRIHVFPILEFEDGLIKKALAKQRRIKKHSTKNIELAKALSRIEEDLEELVRLEEKKIFTALSENIAPNQILSILELLSEKADTPEQWDDVFWK